MRAMLELREFTIRELAEAAGINIDTARTVVTREKGQFLTRVDVVSTGKRGGKWVRYRLAPDAEGELRARIGAVTDALAPAVEGGQESVGLPTALLAAEEALLDPALAGSMLPTQLALAALGLRRGREALS